MAITILFDKNDPANSEDPRNGAAEIRQFKQALVERFNQGTGLFLEDPSGTDANAGRLCAGLQATNKWRGYETNKTTVMFEWDDSASTFVVGDGKVGANPYELIADKASAKRTDFDKGAARAYSNVSLASVAAAATFTWPTAGSEPAITLSNEAAPIAFVAGYIRLSRTGAGNVWASQCRIEFELNSSGTWVTNLLDTVAVGHGRLWIPDTASGEGTVIAVSGILTNAVGALTADDVLKLRWFVQNDASSAVDMSVGNASLALFEITQ